MKDIVLLAIIDLVKIGSWFVIMSSTTAIGRVVMWQIEEYDEFFRLIAPSGFVFEFANTTVLFEVMKKIITKGSYFNTRNQETLYISLDGNVYTLITDKWINPGWEVDQKCASVSELSRALLQAIEEKYERLVSSSSKL